MTAGGEQVRVDSERLRASRLMQAEQAARVSEIACRVRSAATVGNAFGKVGDITGLDASYRAWVDGEANGLEQLTRMVNDLADALGMTADAYDGTDDAVAARVRAAYRSPW